MVWWLKKRQLVHPSTGCVCNEFCLVLGLKVRCTRRGFCIFFCIFIGLNTEIYDIWSVYYKKIINTVVFLSHIRQKQRYHAVIKPFNTECQRLSSFFLPVDKIESDVFSYGI